MNRLTATVACVLALVLAASACTHDARKPTTVQLADPGHCTAVDVVAAPETAALLHSLADNFNSSPSAKLGPQGCAFVRVQWIDSAKAVRGLVAGWTDTATLGPQPEIWAPASSAWLALANERLAAKKSPAVAAPSSSFARTPLVLALPAPFAHALGWPKTPVGWRTLARLAADPLGWGAVGHPEWGPFKLGKANPNASTNALLATLAVGRLHDPAIARALESSVVYYGDADWPFLDTLNRLDKKNPTSHFVSAVITDARSVTAYNRGSPNGIVPTTTTHTKPRVPLVAINPREGGGESDNPLAIIRRSWVSADARAGAAAFVAYAHTAEAQQKVAAAGLAPGRVRPETSLASFGAVDAALADWEKTRKRARVLLVFDESDSMGDPSDSRDPASAPKIALAKKALLGALSQFGPDDEVGLRIFTTHVRNSPSRNWADVVPIGRFGTHKRALVNAIKNLAPKQGSPLYAATRGAYDTVHTKYDSSRINAVVLLTDGYNEDDHDNNRTALLAHLREPVRVFTISYSGDADLATLRKIAQATNSRVYDATITSTIGTMYLAALENF
jgi:Ca-activated chloride channel homolog